MSAAFRSLPARVGTGLALVLTSIVACSAPSEDDGGPSSSVGGAAFTGGAVGSGGAAATGGVASGGVGPAVGGSGGIVAIGGAAPVGGTGGVATGGTGGIVGTGGDLGTGGLGTGGLGTGGAVATGGSATGGSSTGGSTQVDTCSSSEIDQKKMLVSNMYTADPSGHVFDGKLYVYPSHDIDAGIPDSNEGDQFAMKDYHVLSLDPATCDWVDEGVALDLVNVPWAKRQLWAPDAVRRGSTYYLVFPARDQSDIFRIGVATSTSPTGPFTARSQPIPNTFSIDPAVFVDDDDQVYLIVGGLMGGQLQKWKTGTYDANGAEPGASSPALGPRIAKLNADLSAISGSLTEISIRDPQGNALLAGDGDRRFFEAAWMHKYNGTYYLSYSTGTTHYIAYATGTSPTGPFTYRGRVLQPPNGWTSHHSIVQYGGTWYLFYHDTTQSGKTHLRNVKMQVLTHGADGSITTLTP